MQRKCITAFSIPRRACSVKGPKIDWKLGEGFYAFSAQR